MNDLVALQRGQRAVLGKRVGVGGRVVLDLFDRLGQRFGRGGVAETPTGHRIGLGEAVDGDGEVVEFVAERGDGDMLGLAVNEFFVDFIREDDDLLFQRDIAQGAEFVFGVDGTGRIAGGVEDDHLGGRGHGFLELLGSHFPTGGFLGVHDHRDAAGEADHFRIGNPKGRGNDHLVTFLDHGEDRVEAGHLRPAGHADLVGGVGEVVVDQELGGERLAQFRDAAGGRVFRPAVAQRLDGGLLDEIRGVHFRFAAGEGVNFLAFGEHGFGLRGDGQSEGWGNLGNTG